MHRNRKPTSRIDLNLLLTIGLLIASFGALIVYIRQASIMNEQTQILLNQSKAGAWPSLSIEVNRGFDQGEINLLNFQISNRGIGPAIVEQTKITFDGQPVETWNSLYNKMAVPESISRTHTNDNLFKRVIRPNEDFLLIDLSINKELMTYVFELSDKVTIEICYTSVYDDCWVVKRANFKTSPGNVVVEKVATCKSFTSDPFLE